MQVEILFDELKKENEMLRQELRVTHEAAQLTADLVIKQFEQTELEKQRFRDAATSLEGFKRTLDQTSDCVFMFDPETYKFIYVNQGGLNHTGYSEDELADMTMADLGASLTTAKLAETLEPLRRNPNDSVLITTTHQRKNGVDVPVEIFLQYIALKGGDGRFFSLVRNISKRLLEEKEKEQMQAQLLHTQKLESVGALAAGIAHEINTPVQYIGSNLKFLEEAFIDLTQLKDEYEHLLAAARKSETLGDEVKSVDECMDEIDLPYLLEEVPGAIAQAKEGVARVSTLVRAMKEFSHPGSKDKEEVDLNRAIKTTIEVARNEWKYFADIDLNLATELPVVSCHANEIGQVILNILVNGAQAIKERLEIKPDTKKGIIKISTEQVDEDVVIEITDNGGGIPAEIVNRIFDPFFTTKEVGKGTGQGLAIALDVIQNKHEGTLEVSSEEGEGSTFTITLPID